MRRALRPALALALLAACDDPPPDTAPGAQTQDARPAAQADATVPGQETGPAAGPSRSDVVAHLAANVIRPALEAFAVQTEALVEATRAHAEARGADAPKAEAARAAWREAMALWQVVEPMQVGPLGPAGRTAEGAGLRDRVYSWPTVNACRVDQVVVSQEYAQAGYLETALVNVVGLDALESLLFRGGTQNACPPQVQINAGGAWAALGEAELNTRRAAYAHALAVELRRTAQEIVTRFAPDGGDFASRMGRAGESGSPYPNVRAALDELFAAMFHLDTQVKDRKLGLPGGLTEGCPAATCPDELESPYAGHARRNLIANVRGFRAFLTGSLEPGAAGAPGFDDLLVAQGAEPLARRLVADTDALLAALEAAPDDLRASLTAQPALVGDLYTAVKRVTDPLKSDFVTALNLTLPMEGAGDND